MTKRTEAVPATTGDASSAPATASGLPKVSETGGEWNSVLLRDVLQVCTGGDLGDKGALEKARAGVAAMRGIAPGDILEDMAAAQLLAAHEATMRCFKLAAVPDQPFPVVHECLNLANRTSRTWAALVEALNRHRGKSGQQTVRVEHVTVADGGQAVIGPVATGGGDDRCGEGQPHALGAPVRCPDPARNVMQGPGGARPETVPDAWRFVTGCAPRQPLRVEAWPLLARGDRAAAGSRRAGAFDARTHAPASDVNRRWRARSRERDRNARR